MTMRGWMVGGMGNPPYDDGKEEGQAIADEAATDEAQKAYEQGYEEGLKIGHDDGYAEGRSDGYAEAAEFSRKGFEV